jgi:hypothetical protein
MTCSSGLRVNETIQEGEVSGARGVGKSLHNRVLVSSHCWSLLSMWLLPSWYRLARTVSVFHVFTQMHSCELERGKPLTYVGVVLEGVFAEA